MARKKVQEVEEPAELTLEDKLKLMFESTNQSSPGSVAFMEGQTGRWSEDRMVSTGVLALDMAIGIGGWPIGRLVEIYGQESSGKTTLCLMTVAQMQSKGMPVLYIDAENALDLGYMKKLGGDPSKMLIGQPASLQNGMDLMVTWMELAMESDLGPSAIFLDSVPALAPSEVLEQSAEKQTRALAARYWSAQLPRIVPMMRKSQTTIFLINQMRSGMDMYTPATTPGGKAIKFNASLRLEIKRKIDGKSQAEGSDGQFTNVKIVKNKVSSPFVEADYYLPSGQHVDPMYDIINTAMLPKYDIVEEDTQPGDDGQYYGKKGWYTYRLREGDLEAIQRDELAAWLSEPGTKKKPHTEDNFVSQWDETDKHICAYRIAKFVEQIEPYPSLLAQIREHVLNALNEGEVSTDEEQFEDMSGDEFLEDEESTEDSEAEDDEQEEEEAQDEE